MNDEQLIEKIELLRPQPGDIIALLCADSLPSAAIERIREHVKRVVPDGVECLILDGGMDIKLLRPEPISAEQAAELKRKHD